MTAELPVRRQTSLLLLLLTLWCALCPLGLPASRATGSAFNPANEVVTTTPRRDQGPAVRVVRRVPAAPVRAPRPAPMREAIVAASANTPLQSAGVARPGATGRTPFLPRAPPLAA